MNHSVIYLRINFLLALLAAAGSLYFSEVMKFPPCSLCWYQRICMYPLVVIFAVALLTDDDRHRRYSLPLIVIGLILAAYHNFLYFGWIDQEIIPCTSGISCSSKQLELFGFITIPLLAFAGFLGMLVVLGMEGRSAHQQRRKQG